MPKNIITTGALEDVYLTPYKSYIAILTQTAPTSYTEGTLAIGRKYIIDTYVAGDDFTNVGAASNEDLVEFVATGNTPAVWTNGSTLNYDGDPSIQGNLQAQNSEDSNFLGDIVWTRSQAGMYVGTLAGAFTLNKTLIFANVTADDLGSALTIQGALLGDETISLVVFDDSGANVDDWVAYMNIIVYQ